MKIQLKSRSKTVFSVSIDNETWGILPSRILQFFSLHPENENELSQDRLNDLIDEIEKYSWDKLLNFLTYRERSVWECSDYLKQLPLHFSLSDKLIQKAKQSSLLDDERFAEMYVLDLIAKNRSGMQIRSKLIEKHISEDIIEKVFSEHFSGKQSEQILSANFRKAINRFHNLPFESRKEKILNYLTRKGFSYLEVKEKLDEEGC